MVLEETILSGINSVGFPIVAFYLMYQMCNKTIAENSRALLELKDAILGR